MKKLVKLLWRYNKITFFFVIVVIIALIYVLSQSSNSNYAAKVNGLEISHEYLRSKTDSTQHFYLLNGQDISDNTARRDSLDQLIDQRIVESYAQNNNITINENDLENMYQARVQTFGDEEKLLAEIEQKWQLNKDAYLATLRYDLLRNAVVAGIDQPFQDWLDDQKDKSDIDIKVDLTIE